METKADKTELHELEDRINEKLNELIKQLMAKFADKAETKKKFLQIEKNVSSLSNSRSKT